MLSPPSHQHKFWQRYKICSNIKKLFATGCFLVELVCGGVDWTVFSQKNAFFYKIMCIFARNFLKNTL